MRTRTRTWLVLPSLLLLVGLQAPPTANAAAGDFGVFSTKCTFSHANSDDPIVYPNDEGAAHRHHFFGNTTTNFSTTTSTLGAGGTSCDRPEDLAAYWAPALYEDGVELPPQEVHVYYRNTNVTNKSVIVPFPRGLRMIAGTSNHPDPPRNKRTAEWSCASGGAVSAGTADIPASCGGNRLIAVITFPSCWDGINLTTADQSHMTYPWQNTARPRACPATHPVTLPEVTEHIRYVPESNDLSGLTLSSGAGSTLHADFWNAWDEQKLAALVTDCLIGGMKCGTIGQRFQ